MSKPNDTIYIYIYHRIDMDTMSCDEFKAKFPVQKRYSITKADAEAMSWRLVYP